MTTVPVVGCESCQIFLQKYKILQCKFCRAKSKFKYLLSVEFVINQSTTNFKSGQSVLAIHDSQPYC